MLSIMRYYNLYKNFKNWWLYLSYKYGLTEVEPLIFETRNGVIVEVPLRLLQTFKEIFMDECYLAGLERSIVPGATIIDIGANVGYFSLFAVSNFSAGRVLAYEPIPVNFAQLQQHGKLNNNNNLLCFPQAVAGAAGEITLLLDPKDSFTTSATVFAQAKTNGSLLRVSCTTLPDIMDNNNIEKCDLLKMDCEGAEYDIFYNCPSPYLKRIDQIAMEVHQGEKENQNIEALIDFFHEQGFATRRRPIGMLWAWRKSGVLP